MAINDQLSLFELPDAHPKHPAKYTDSFLPIFAQMLWGTRNILDPFGGTGKIFLLNQWLPEAQIRAIEIEPEWASMHPRMIVGNALHLPFQSNSFDGICTSPTYGNRMADTLMDDYERITYTSKLGRRLHPDNSGAMQWGETYRDFHVEAWREIIRTLQPGGRLVLNMKDHIRNGERQYVTEWHVQTLIGLGLMKTAYAEVRVPSMQFGQNSEVRVGYENIILFERN